MKLTKYCFLPWTFMQIHAGGMMQCCAVGPDTDIGDFLLDYTDKVENGEEADPFNNKGLQAIREGLLTGNLRPMCRNCFFVKNQLITTSEFERRLKEFIKERKPELELEHADLKKVYAYSWMAISFTNRCNLSCVYCVQSVHKDTNPYFKMDFPYEYAERTLDYFAEQGISKFSTCVEGEATLYKHWYELFSAFHQKYPHIKLRMTTNLNRKFSDKEIGLLCSYHILDISIDSVDPELYRRLRVHGRLELVMENLDKIDEKVRELGIKGPNITIHPVVSDATWQGLEQLADFAFSRGYGLELGNYEERGNTVAYQQKMLKPLSAMPLEEQKKARDIMQGIARKAKQIGVHCGLQGEIFGEVNAAAERNYNYFQPYDENPVFKQFFLQFPKGNEKYCLDIVYDADNISHEGIAMYPESEVELSGLDDFEYVVLREIYIYKEGKLSPRYGQTVMLRYRRKIKINDGKLYLAPGFVNDDIRKILIEVCGWKEKNGLQVVNADEDVYISPAEENC